MGPNSCSHVGRNGPFLSWTHASSRVSLYLPSEFTTFKLPSEHVWFSCFPSYLWDTQVWDIYMWLYHLEVLQYWREVPRLILFNHTPRCCTFATPHAPWIRLPSITIFPAHLIVQFTMKCTITSPTQIPPNSKAKWRMTPSRPILRQTTFHSKSPYEKNGQRGFNSQSDHYIHGPATWLPILYSCLQCPYCQGLCMAFFSHPLMCTWGCRTLCSTNTFQKFSYYCFSASWFSSFQATPSAGDSWQFVQCQVLSGGDPCVVLGCGCSLLEGECHGLTYGHIYVFFFLSSFLLLTRPFWNILW